MEQQTDFEKERRQLTLLAWWVTGCYCVILLFLALMVVFWGKGPNSFRLIEPNEVGDLLAGIAGPLAFIWLVYGYFLQGIAIRQQAEELRQNTLALKLQAEELKNSVEQQRELVDVSKKQLDFQLDSFREALERRRSDGQPKFLFHTLRTGSPYDRSEDSGYKTATMELENIGAAVTSVVFSHGSHLGLRRLRDMTTFESRRKVAFSCRYRKKFESENMWVRIEFTDSFGIRAEKCFDVIPGGLDGLFDGIVVEPKSLP